MLANRLEALEKRVKELEDFNTPAEKKLELLRNQIDRVDKKVQDLETKTSSDFSQPVFAESATSEEEYCLWVARDKSGRAHLFDQEPYIVEGSEWSCKSLRWIVLLNGMLPQVTWENSPQKLVLESTISKMETVGKDFDRERALDLLDIIDAEYSDCVTDKVTEKAIEELRQMVGNE